MISSPVQHPVPTPVTPVVPVAAPLRTAATVSVFPGPFLLPRSPCTSPTTLLPTGVELRGGIGGAIATLKFTLAPYPMQLSPPHSPLQPAAAPTQHPHTTKRLTPPLPTNVLNCKQMGRQMDRWSHTLQPILSFPLIPKSWASRRGQGDGHWCVRLCRSSLSSEGCTYPNEKEIRRWQIIRGLGK